MKRLTIVLAVILIGPGVIAAPVGEVLPEIVTYKENGIDASGMDYSKLTSLLVEAVNALRSKNAEHIALPSAGKDTQINELLAENESLRARLESLEQAFSIFIQEIEKENRQ